MIQQGTAAGATPTGKAAVYYRIGTEPPVQVITPFYQLGNEPQSLVLWFFNDSIQPVPFLAYLAIQSIYIGPGEYKGNVNDIAVGFGVASGAGDNPVWTAGDATASDLTTYFVEGNASALIGSFSSQGLVPGPLLGPPDDPPPLNRPSASILFCFFTNQGTE